VTEDLAIGLSKMGQALPAAHATGSRDITSETVQLTATVLRAPALSLAVCDGLAPRATKGGPLPGRGPRSAEIRR
jgi:hypothetical protein